MSMHIVANVVYFVDINTGFETTYSLYNLLY